VSNHPNRASSVSLSRNPSPDEVKATREWAGLTQTEAGEMVHTTCRAWQQWEAGDRRMHPAFWELFRRKIATAPPAPSAKGSDMPAQHATARRAAVATRAPLTPEQRVLYAAAMADTEAVFALEDMTPSPQDKAITAAIVAGLVAPEQAREELHAYVLEHKTVRGFIESRPWAVR
jgi:DNA-binding XRE family transcriptional regulator